MLLFFSHQQQNEWWKTQFIHQENRYLSQKNVIWIKILLLLFFCLYPNHNYHIIQDSTEHWPITTFDTVAHVCETNGQQKKKNLFDVHLIQVCKEKTCPISLIWLCWQWIYTETSTAVASVIYWHLLPTTTYRKPISISYSICNQMRKNSNHCQISSSS